MQTVTPSHSKGLLETSAVRDHFNEIAAQYDYWKKKNWYYYDQLKEFLTSVIPPASRVLELGCGTGDLLAHVQPSRGLGIDLSEEMVRHAHDKHPQLEFRAADAGELSIDETFDYVIMADLVDHLPDIWQVLMSLRGVVREGGVLAITTINPLWDPILMACEKLGMKMPEGPHNFVPKADLANLLRLCDFDIRDEGFYMLMPKYIPVVSNAVNRIARRLPFVRNFCCAQYLVAVKKAKSEDDNSRKQLTCSVIVPCHNEQDNVAECVRRTPKMGDRTEILFVDDGSTDDTADRVNQLAREHPHVRLLSHMPNRGKGYAVKRGFEEASGDIVMILDADMTVPPEDLPKFFRPLSEGKAAFVNGSRLVYPMEDEAMRTLNLIGNKMFSVIFTWLLGQRVTDTLCGTKALFKKDFKRIHMEKDPWGDFDLLFGASKLGLHIVEMPVRYRRRVAGESKMRAFKHGWMLLRMCFRGFRELKWQPLWHGPHRQKESKDE